MIPMQLTIQGLYSYREKQTIDFSRLTDAHLFGIFGQVGSGKSTLLEAITFAIYGRTDRLNLAGDNRFYNMMNLKSNELLIDFIFQAGKKASLYRSIVKGKRNSRKFEEVKALERTAYRKNGDDWLPVEPGALEEAVGLSYDNFKRTIIIPQGQFQDFLQLGNKDRTQMMKELFSLGKFEFFGKVSSLETKNNARKQHLEGEIQGLGTTDPSIVEGFLEEMSRLEKELEALKSRQHQAQTDEGNWQKLKEKTERLDQAKETLRQTLSEESRFTEREEKLHRYENCNSLFRSLFDSLDAAEKSLKERKANISTLEKEVKTQLEEIKQMESSLDASREAYDKREELPRRADDYQRLAQIGKLQAEISAAEGRLHKGTEVCRETAQLADLLKKQKTESESWIREKRGQLPDLTILAAAKAWFSEKKNLEEQMKSTREEITAYHKEMEINRKEFGNLLSDPILTGLTKGAGREEISRFLDVKTVEVRNLIKGTEGNISHLRVKEQLKTYAEKLTEGDACPVCGSTHHPVKFDAAGLAEELSREEALKGELEARLNEMARLAKNLDTLETALEMATLHLGPVTDRLEALKKKLADHLVSLTSQAYQDEKAVEKAFRDAETAQNDLKKAEKELGGLTGELAKTEDKLTLYQKELNKIELEKATKESQVTMLLNQLILVRAEEGAGKSEEELMALRNELLEKYRHVTREFEEKSRLVQEMKSALGVKKGRLEAMEREWEQENRKWQELLSRQQETLASSTYASVEEVKAILSEQWDIEAERQMLREFRASLALSRSLVQQYHDDLGNLTYEAGVHQKLKDELAELEAAIRNRTERRGELNGMITALKEKLERMKLLRNELEKTEQRGENIKVLKSLFKASGFVNYISSVFLQNLCQAANERFFQMTRQKLSLEVTDDNAFEIRDYLNGGKVRSVKTLSGGQTFQAALSLALALADNIQRMTESDRNFFFLDEGFGSLDKESLNVVFDTLKSLRKENRIVGVISHVEEMQQEIGVHLFIDNHDERGSIIKPGWLS